MNHVKKLLLTSTAVAGICLLGVSVPSFADAPNAATKEAVKVALASKHLAAETNLTARRVGDGTSILVAWDAIPHATHYELRYARAGIDHRSHVIPLGGARTPLERQRPAARHRRVRRVKSLDERPGEPFGLGVCARVRRVLEQLGKRYVLVFRQRIERS